MQDGAAEPLGEVPSAGEEGGRWSGRASGLTSAGQTRSGASGPGSSWGPPSLQAPGHTRAPVVIIDRPRGLRALLAQLLVSPSARPRR